MKIKLSWIFFIPMFIAVAVLRVADGMGTPLFGLSSLSAAYISAGLAGLLWVICALISLIDKKTSGIYITGKNPVSGILSWLAAAAVSGDCALDVMSCLSSGEWQVLSAIDMFLSVVAAVAFLVIGTGFFTGKNYTMGMSVLMLAPAIWSCVRVIMTFWGYSTYSVSSTDMTDLVAYVLLTLYFFSMASVITVMSGKNPVKACFVYGLPAALVVLGYGISRIVAVAVGTAEPQSLLDGELAEFVVFGLLILSNLITLTLKAKTVEENKGLLLQMEEENEEYDDEQDGSSLENDFIITSEENEEPTKIVREKISEEDFVRVPVSKEPVEISEQVEVQEIKTAPVAKQEVPEEKVEAPVSVQSESASAFDKRMSEIDRLIFEIENGSKG